MNPSKGKKYVLIGKVLDLIFLYLFIYNKIIESMEIKETTGETVCRKR